MRKLVVVVALVLSMSGAAWAQNAVFVRGSELLDWCQSTDRMREAICHGYVLGVADVLAAKGICLPKNYNRQLPVNIVKIWLEKNPKDRNHSADGLVVRALTDAWSCK